MAERIAQVLDAFSSERAVQTASETGRRAQLPSSSAHRIIDELVRSGLLERDEENRVHLGMRLWELALRGHKELKAPMRVAASAPPALRRTNPQGRAE